MNSKVIKKTISFFTLSKPLSRIVIFSFTLLILTIIPISTLEASPNFSICKKIFGNHCYSVGITRGVSSLLKGNLSQAIKYNWLAIPTLITMLIILGIDLIKIKKPLLISQVR